MQWFLSTQPPNQTKLKFHGFRHVIRMKPRETYMCFENKIEKHDAIVLAIVETYINRKEKKGEMAYMSCTH